MAKKTENNPVYVALEFLEDTLYKGKIRKKGDKLDVDESYAKNFVAQGRAKLAAGKSSKK